MAIPLQSLSGTEVLRRGGVQSQSNATTEIKFDGTLTAPANTSNVVPANHIITILSIFVCEQGDAAEAFTFWMNESGGGAVYLIQHQGIGPFQTYIWNDPITLVGGDKLSVSLQNAGNVDIWVSYIDQSWV